MTIKAEKFDNEEELLDKHPGAKWHEYGPIHKHGEKYFVQVYLGQHEWLSINVDNISEIYYSPGWLGDEFGWAYVPETALSGFSWPAEEIDPPQRPGKPITGDEVMFGEKDKIIKYLGEDDPIAKNLLVNSND